MEGVAGLLFDVRGVLYDHTMWQRWLFQLLTRMGLHSHFVPFFRLWEQEYQPAVNAGRRPFWEALREFLRAVGLSRSQLDEVEAAAQARFRKFDEHILPLPGVARTLTRLAARDVELAVLGNAPWSTAELREHLARLGLDQCFPTLVSTLDLASQSPATDRFAAALAAMRLAADQVAFVGQAAPELAHAAEVGLHTIAINHEADAQAEVYLDQFDQLLEVVRFDTPAVLAG